jgi:hypothetical protein
LDAPPPNAAPAAEPLPVAVADDGVAVAEELPQAAITADNSPAATSHRLRLLASNRRTVARRRCWGFVGSWSSMVVFLCTELLRRGWQPFI